MNPKKKLSDLAHTFKREGDPGVNNYDEYWSARKKLSEIPYTPREERIVQEIRKAIPHKSAILDLGVGPGYYFRSLMNDYEMYGIEISGAMIESYEFDTGRIVPCDLNKEFPRFHVQFDAVIASMIFHHLDDPDQLVGDVSRSLKPNGLLIVACPNIWHIKNRLRFLRGSPISLSPAHRNTLTPKSLSRKIENAGFLRLKLLPARPSQNGGLARIWPSLGAGQLILLFRRNETRDQ